MTAIEAFIQSQAGAALLAMVGVAFADFLTGAYAALADGTFALDALAAFLRKHVLGRVAPIGTLLVLGYFGGGTIGTLFMASALASAGIYVTETASSIIGNLRPPKQSDIVETTPAALANPVPTE